MASLTCYSPEQRDYLDTLFGRITRHYGDTLVALAVYGSMARGDNRLRSDCDLLIVVDGDRGGRLARLYEFSALERSLDDAESRMLASGVTMEVSPFILSRDQAVRFNPLYLDMCDHAVIIEDRDGFLSAVLARMRAKREAWGSRKTACANGWAWDIKPDMKWGESLDYDQ